MLQEGILCLVAGVWVKWMMNGLLMRCGYVQLLGLWSMCLREGFQERWDPGSWLLLGMTPQGLFLKELWLISHVLLLFDILGLQSCFLLTTLPYVALWPQLLCGICFETHPVEKMKAPSCGHFFCNSCWTGGWCCFSGMSKVENNTPTYNLLRHWIGFWGGFSALRWFGSSSSWYFSICLLGFPGTFIPRDW